MTSLTLVEKRQLIYQSLIKFALAHNGATPTQSALWRQCYKEGLLIVRKNFRSHLKYLRSAGLIEYRDNVLVIMDGHWQAPLPMPVERFKPVKTSWHRVRNPSPETNSRSVFVQLGERDGYKCAQCRTDKSLEVDHIVPRSIGGSDHLSNLQLLCTTCNIDKANRAMDNSNHDTT